jgi:PEP-CTERM motif
MGGNSMSTRDFSGLRKLLIAAAAGVLLSFGVASAVTVPIDVNINYQTDGVILTRAFDWNEAGSGLPIYAADNPLIPGDQTGTAVKPGDPLVAGQALSFLYQANLVSATAPGGGTINPANLNGALPTNYEVTIVARINETVTDFGVIGGAQIATFSLTGGTMNIYLDQNVNANTLAGTGFDDGTQVLTGTVQSGDSIFSFITTGPFANTGQGSSTTEIAISPINYDHNFFQTDVLHDLDFTTQLKFPAGTSTTTCFFCGGAGAPFGDFTGFNPATDLLLKADASNIFTAEKVPEAGSLVLFGSGLLGLVTFLRRRSAKNK